MESLDKYKDLIEKNALKYGVHPDLVRSVIWQESRGNAGAKSKAGAQGLMQLMPDTAAELGVKDPFDPAQNIEGGTKYLKQQIDKFGLTKGLAAYNAGAGNVEKYGDIPPFKETLNYVKNIVGTFAPKLGLGGFLANEEAQPKIPERNAVAEPLEPRGSMTREQMLATLQKGFGGPIAPAGTQFPTDKVLGFSRGLDPDAVKNLQHIFGRPLAAVAPDNEAHQKILEWSGQPLISESTSRNMARALMAGNPLTSPLVAKYLNPEIGDLIPKSISDIGEGIERAGSSNIRGLSSPASIGLAGAMLTPAAPYIAAGLVPSMAKSAYESGAGAVGAISAGDTAGATEGILNAGLAAGMAYGGARPVFKGVYGRARPRADIASAESVGPPDLGLKNQFTEAGVPPDPIEIARAIEPPIQDFAPTPPPPVPPELPNLATKAAGMREHGFITTVKESPNTPQNVSSQLAGDYTKLNKQDLVLKASSIVDADFIKAKDLVLNAKEPTAEINAIGIELIKRFNKIGDYDAAIGITKHLAPMATKAGQANWALSLYDSLGPEGFQRLAVRTIENAQHALPDFKKRQLNLKSDDVLKRFESLEKDPASLSIEDFLSQEIPKEFSYSNQKSGGTYLGSGLGGLQPLFESGKTLAKKVESSLEPAQPKKMTPESEAINTLFSVAKERLPNKLAIVRDPIGFISNAIKNRGSYSEIWGEAQRVLTEKFKNDPKQLSALQNFLNNPLDSPYSKRVLAKSIGIELKNKGVDLNQIVREHYSSADKTVQALSSKMIEKSGLSGEEAGLLAQEVHSHILSKMTEKKQKILDGIFKERKTPEQKTLDAKIIELSNLGAFDAEKARSLTAQKLGLPHISDELSAKIVSSANAIQAMPEGRERALATAKLINDISEQVPVSLGRKVGTVQTIAQLLNPKTTVRNVLGNVGFAALENVKDLAAAPIDKAVSIFTKQRTKTLGLDQIKAQLEGGRTGLIQGAQEAWRGYDLKNIADKWELNQAGEMRAPFAFKNKPLRTLEKALGVTLKAPDRAFYQAAFDKSLVEQIGAHNLNNPSAKITKPTPEMFAEAHLEGLYKTFQDESALAKLFSGLKKNLNLEKDFGLGDIFLKYTKTPANLINRSAAYSPAGAIRPLFELAKSASGRGFNQKAFVESSARSLIGTGGLTATGYILAKSGLLKSQPTKYDKNAELRESMGIKGSQLNVSGLVRWAASGFDKEAAKWRSGDLLVSYDWAVPMSVSMNVGVKMYDREKKAADDESKLGYASDIANSLASGLDVFGEQPLMKGIASLGKGKPFSEVATDIVASAPASFTPSFLKGISDTYDNTLRSTDSNNFFEEAKNKVIARTPLQTSLPKRYNLFGDEMQSYQNNSNSLFNVFLNPSFTSRFSPTPESGLAYGISRSTGETKAIPDSIGKKEVFHGIPLEFSAKNRSALQKELGEKSSNILRTFAENAQFGALPALQQQAIVSKFLSESKEQVLSRYFKALADSKGESREEFIKKLIEKNSLSQREQKELFNSIMQ